MGYVVEMGCSFRPFGHRFGRRGVVGCRGSGLIVAEGCFEQHVKNTASRMRFVFFLALLGMNGSSSQALKMGGRVRILQCSFNKLSLPDTV